MQTRLNIYSRIQALSQQTRLQMRRLIHRGSRLTECTVNGTDSLMVTNGLASVNVLAASHNDISNARRVCFFAHYHPHGIVAAHVLQYLAALRAEEFSIVVLSTADLSWAEQVRLRPFCDVLIMRENIGLDFGGWMEALAIYSPLRAEYLLLTNDSVYAPIGDFSAFFRKLTSQSADFYGAVESIQTTLHLQSWFVLLRPDAYNCTAFKKLMTTPMPIGLSKSEIIEQYEIGLTVALNDAGLKHHAYYSPRNNGWIAKKRPYNGSQVVWRQLIEDGLPFLKIDVLRDNPVRMQNIEEWREVVQSLSPSMVSLIEDDIRLRRSFTKEERWAREHWYWSLYIPDSPLWPELRRLVARDHRSVGLESLVNRFCFQMIEYLSSAVRPRVKRLVHARDERRARTRVVRAKP